MNNNKDFVYFRVKTLHEQRPWNNKTKPAYLYYFDDEFIDILQEWFDETDDNRYVGETDQCALGFISSLVMSNYGIKHIVQLGTYTGLTALVIGKILQIRGSDGKLITMDIDDAKLNFTKKYIDKSKTNERIECLLKSSIDKEAVDSIENEIELLFIDSLHVYEQTIKELELWYSKVKKTGIILFHDASPYVCDGGVNKAIREFCGDNKINYNILVPPVYDNPCGLGIIVKE